MFLQEGDMADMPSAEVPLYQCTQHGQKLDKLEATVLLESYNLIVITEVQWEKSHDWSMIMEAKECSE